jgi:F0F1-type ATP synthase membrane subunit b/b'
MNEFSGAEAIAVVAIVFGIVKVLTGPIARAIGDRLRGTRPAVQEPVLAAEVDALRTRLAEVEERLDFAERLLASARQADQLPGGAHR